MHSVSLDLCICEYTAYRLFFTTFFLFAKWTLTWLIVREKGDRGSFQLLFGDCFNIISHIWISNYILSSITKLQGLNLFWFRQVIHRKRSLAQTNTKPHMDFGGVIFSLIINIFEPIYTLHQCELISLVDEITTEKWWCERREPQLQSDRRSILSHASGSPYALYSESGWGRHWPNKSEGFHCTSNRVFLQGIPFHSLYICSSIWEVRGPL